MNATAEIFQSNRSRMLGVAYRLLGSRSDAEDVLQDAFLNWCQCSQENIQSATAFLVTITKRLCFDRLRKVKQEREHRAELGLPLPVAEDEFPSAETQLEAVENASAAFVAVLERLGPEERVAFLLHDVFDYEYPEVAQTLGKNEATCRQVIHRARERVRDSRARFSVTSEARQRRLRKFVVATRTGDRKDVMALICEDLENAAGPSEDLTVASGSGARRPAKQRPGHRSSVRPCTLGSPMVTIFEVSISNNPIRPPMARAGSAMSARAGHQATAINAWVSTRWTTKRITRQKWSERPAPIS